MQDTSGFLVLVLKDMQPTMVVPEGIVENPDTDHRNMVLVGHSLLQLSLVDLRPVVQHALRQILVHPDLHLKLDLVLCLVDEQSFTILDLPCGDRIGFRRLAFIRRCPGIPGRRCGARFQPSAVVQAEPSMVISDIIPPSLLRDRLQSLAELYHRADEAVATFCEGSGLACPHGCGTCCEGFVPDVMPLEAAAVAVFLADKDKAAAWSLAGSGRGQSCPLYAADTPWHCSVYEARPLVCRLFAFSAVRDKRGQSSFALCRLMPAAADTAAPGRGVPFAAARSACGPSIIETFGAQPPLMADYGSEILALDPHSNGDRAPLPEALADALSQVLFLVGMKAMDEQDDHRDDDPDLRPPMPRAS